MLCTHGHSEGFRVENEKPVKLKEAIDILDKSVTETLLFFETLDPSNLQLTLRAFKALGDSYDQLLQNTKILGALYDKYSNEVIPNALHWDDPSNRIDSIKVSGFNFILSTRVNANIPENKRDAAHKWLTDVAKIPELIIPRVNPKQLSAFVKSYFEAHAEYPPEDAINVHQQNYIQVRKA